MKTLTTLLFCICINAAVTAQGHKEINEINGTWIPVQQEMGGKALPAVGFDKQKLIIRDSIYIFNAESEDKGSLTYANGKMDIYGRQGVNTGKHFTTIYKLENGQLTICYNLRGDSYPEAFDTKGKPLYFMVVYKKVSEK